MDVSFFTDEGVAVPGVTTAEMREIDRIAVEETGPNLFQMMENAGRNLAAVCLDSLGSRRRSSRVVVLAGTGGNGGGGMAAGRHLASRGVHVDVAVTDVDRLGEVPRVQLDLLRLAGGDVVADPAGLSGVDLVVDAVIGYGLGGAPDGRAGEFIEFAATSGAPVISLDVPSGVDATTGTTPGVAVAASTTMTLALPKTGLHGEHTGRLLLGDIGIPRAVHERAGVAVLGDVFGGRWVVPLRIER